MTAPIASDYPDWGRYQAQATKVYARADVVASTVDTTIDLGYVGDISNLGVYINCTVNSIVVSVDFFSDATGLLALGNHTFSLRQLTTFARTLPTLGPFCRVTFFIGVSPATYSYRFFQGGRPFTSFDNSSSANILLSDFGVTAFAPGNTNVDAGRVWPGEAELYAEIPAGGGYVALFGVSATGPETFITRITGGGTVASRRVFLPAQTPRIRVNNAAGVPALFVFALSAQVLD